jgi:glycosyltransferase involved in cell wall biosynthesis
MKYNLLIHSIHRGGFTGGPRTILALLRSLDRKLFHPILVTNGRTELYHHALELDVTVVSLPVPIFHPLKPSREILEYLKALADVVTQHECNALWTRGATGVYLSLPVARTNGIPLLWDCAVAERASKFVRPINWVLLSLCSRVILQGPTVGDELFGEYVTRIVSHIEILSPPLEEGRRERVLAARTGRGTDEQETASEGNSVVTSTPYNIVSIGTLHPRKNQELLLRAYARVKKELPTSQLLFIGAASDKKYAARLEEIADSLNIADQVNFLGWREDSLELLANADLLVQSSTAEGLPHTIREAMYAGVPVVASRVGAMPDFVRDGVTGWLFEPNDTASLASTLIEAVTDEAGREGIASSAFEMAAETFDEAAWANSYNRIIEEACLDQSK